MADLKRTIEILFEGTNRTGTAITSVGRDLDKLNASVGSVSAPFASLTTAVVKLDAVLIAMAASGLAFAFSESSKLQSAFTELKKVVGDNDEALSVAKTTAKDLSGAYGESAASILESTANYVQAGFTVNESMELAKTGMDLVIAGGVEASQSSEILIATLKGFKAPASDAGRLLDILNEVSNRYATDIEQLGIGMAGLSPIARTMGFSFEETAGLLTPVIEVFRSGDEAAVALKTGLLRLLDDSKPVQEALASIGVSQRDSNGELRSGKDILLDVSKAFQTLDQNQKLFVTQQLVGIHQSARMVEVFDGLGKSTEITAVAMNAAGSASKEVAERLKDPEVAINRLIQGFKNLSSSMGDEFQQAGVGVIDGFTGIFNAIEKSVGTGAFDPILDALNRFLDGVSESLRSIARNLPEALEGVDYSGFVHSLESIKETIGSLFDGIDFNDPKDLEKAIQGIIDTLESLVRFSDGIAGIFIKVGKEIIGLIEKFNDLDDETKSTFGSISGIGSVLSGVTGPIGEVTGAIKGIGLAMNVLAGGQIVSLVKSLIGTGGLTAAFTAVEAAVAANPLLAAGAAGLAMGTVWRKLVPEVDAAAQSVLGFIDKHTGLIGVQAQQAENEQQWIEIQERWKSIMEDRKAAAVDAEADFIDAKSQIDATTNSTAELTEQMRALGILVEEKKTVNIDTTEAVSKLQTLEYYRESTGTWETITVPVDISQVQKAKEAIEEIPAVKRFELENDLHIAEIKAQAETVQSAFEWRAKVDIAEIEAGTERVKAIAENISTIFTDTGDLIGGLFSQLGDTENTGQRYNIERAIDAEQERRDKALELQEKMTLSEVAYRDAMTERLKSGGALITVNGDGLAPHLEMIMWELFAAIQIRATQEGIDSLLLGGK
ncbi:phage tail tape measure protein [uncultured Desulfosarcina sp.]|uniref:phage tail tape measure protein n=1 Tax=uncultured Desulfosarcina sp. TaxID=218289 RepID=UPI0029C62984|nr:phage tail tape measure protein [uncultured Desulfosarcina sp.]